MLFITQMLVHLNLEYLLNRTGKHPFQFRMNIVVLWQSFMSRLVNSFSLSTKMFYLIVSWDNLHGFHVVIIPIHTVLYSPSFLKSPLSIACTSSRLLHSSASNPTSSFAFSVFMGLIFLLFYMVIIPIYTVPDTAPR